MTYQFFQQAEQFFKPMSEMMALNARTLEALAEKQTGLMSAVWSDGLNYAKNMTDNRDMTSFFSSQNNFFEGINEKFSSAARDSYSLLTEAQEEMGKLMQNSMSAVDMSSMAQPFTQAAHETQDAAKDTMQEASKTTAKTAQKAQAQPSKGAGKSSGTAS